MVKIVGTLVVVSRVWWFFAFLGKVVMAPLKGTQVACEVRAAAGVMVGEMLT